MWKIYNLFSFFLWVHVLHSGILGMWELFYIIDTMTLSNEMFCTTEMNSTEAQPRFLCLINAIIMQLLWTLIQWQWFSTMPFIAII